MLLHSITCHNMHYMPLHAGQESQDANGRGSDSGSDSELQGSDAWGFYLKLHWHHQQSQCTALAWRLGSDPCRKPCHRDGLGYQRSGGSIHIMWPICHDDDWYFIWNPWPIDMMWQNGKCTSVHHDGTYQATSDRTVTCMYIHHCVEKSESYVA